MYIYMYIHTHTINCKKKTSVLSHYFPILHTVVLFYLQSTGLGLILDIIKYRDICCHLHCFSQYQM